MTWLSKVRELEERLAEDCEAFDGQETSLVFVAESAKPETRNQFLKALKPLQHRSGMTMLARLNLPNRDQKRHLVEVNITGPDAARTSFAELTGKAGLLIPENVISSLDRFEPSKGKMTARGRFIALLWQLECNRRIEAGDSTWLELDGTGGESVFGIPDPFRLARLLLKCFRANPGAKFVLPEPNVEAADSEVAATGKTLAPNEWPPNEGWNFREGQAAFRGVEFDIEGVQWRLLKALAKKPGTPVGKKVLGDAIADDGCTGEESLRTHLSRLRIRLRKVFKFKSSPKTDPVPNMERGKDGAWKLDEQVFPSVAEIKRWLNAR